MSSIAEFAFADALLALDELDHTEIADRLRARWPEVGTPSDDALAAENQQLRDAVLQVADGMLTDPCWCGDEWWALHDLEVEPREHSEWCAHLRHLILDGTPSAARTLEEPQPTKGTGSS